LMRAPLGAGDAIAFTRLSCRSPFAVEGGKLPERVGQAYAARVRAPRHPVDPSLRVTVPPAGVLSKIDHARRNGPEFGKSSVT
jgi:hypothetical protein